MTTPLEKICDSFVIISEKLKIIEYFLSEKIAKDTLDDIKELFDNEHTVLIAYINDMRYKRQQRRKKYRRNVQMKKFISSIE